MWLLPLDLVFVILTAYTVIYIIYVIIVVKTQKKLVSNRDLINLVTGLTDMLTGGTKLEKDIDLQKFNIDGVDYTVKDNDLTLAELVLQSDVAKDYEDYLAVIKSILVERYKKFRFLRISPTYGDYNSGYFLSFTITRDQVPVEYEYLFRLAVSKGLTDSNINDAFFKAVKSGEILPLGDVEIVVGTGISPVTQADDIIVNIVFMPRDYYEKHLALQEEGD